MWHAQLRVTSLIRLCLLPLGRLGQKYTILLTSSGQRGCGKSKLPLVDEDTSSPALLKRVGICFFPLTMSVQRGVRQPHATSEVQRKGYGLPLFTELPRRLILGNLPLATLPGL